jgi:hypothetical protein
MNRFSILFCAFACTAAAGPVHASSSGPVFYGDPPDEHHPWAVHDGNRPQPKVVSPGTFSTVENPGRPPSDAVVLFDGTDLSNWESANEGRGPAKWLVKEGAVQVTPSTGDIQTKEEFADCQLHVEWAEPTDIKGTSQGRGNSGIFLMGVCEIQVLDSYNNVTYADGAAASVYGINPPLANALRPPGEFQVYDIVFRRPIFRDGKQVDPGYVTVFVNGVLAQDHTPFEGSGGHMKRSKPRPFPEKGPLRLQDHGNRVRFRNIWYRPLPPRAIEGGTDGYLTTEVTMSKRKEIAAAIRQDASGLGSPSNPLPQMFRLMESLEYEKDAAVEQQVSQMAETYVSSLKQLPPEKLGGKKDEVKEVGRVLKYLTNFKILDQNFVPNTELQRMIKEQRWDK